MANVKHARGMHPDSLTASQMAELFAFVILGSVYANFAGFNSAAGKPTFGDVNIGAAVGGVAITRFLRTRGANLVALRFGTGQQVLTAATQLTVTVEGTAFTLTWNATSLEYEVTSAPLAALVDNAGACIGINSIAKLA